MKHSKLLLLLAGFTALTGLAGCGANESTSSVTPSTPDTSTSTPDSSEHAENTFGEGITEAEKAILAKISSGSFTKPAFEAQEVLKVKYEVRNGDTLKEIIYKGEADTGFIKGIKVYIGVNVDTLKITGVQYEGDLTTHGQDAGFKDNDLGMTGTDGSTFESVTGSTVTSTAINKVAKAAVAAVKAEVEEPEHPDVPEKESYTVIFDAKGGICAAGPVKVEAGQLVERPINDPVKQDYNFIGWFIKGTDTKFDFTTKITADITLEARYQSAYVFHNGVILEAPKPGKDGKVVIPSDIEGQTVTELTEHLYENNTELKEVVIPASVKIIGFNCFTGCTNLKKVSIYQTQDAEGNIVKELEIRLRSFEGCTALEEFTVPASTKSISQSSFKGCTGLKKVTFGGQVEIPENLFEGCTGLKEVVLSKEPTKIRKQAFLDCSSLTTITNSESITEIGEKAFENCTSLKELHLGKNFKYTLNCFSGCINLSNITIDPANEKYATVNNIIYEASKGEPSKLIFILDTNITTYEFPVSVRSYDYHVFDNCTKLKTITVAEGNTGFFAKNGVLFAHNGSDNLVKYVPQGFEGNLELAANDKFTTSGVPFANVKGLKDIVVDPESKFFEVVDGCVLSKGYSKQLCYVNKSKTGVVKTNVSKIGEYALAYHQGITDLVLTYDGWSPVDLGKGALEGVNPELKVWVPAGKYSSYTGTGYSAWDKEYQHFVQKEAYVEPADPAEPQA